MSGSFQYLSYGVALHVLHGSLLLVLLVLLLQGVQLLLPQEGGAGVDGVVLQVGRGAPTPVYRRPETGLLQNVWKRKWLEREM